MDPDCLAPELPDGQRVGALEAALRAARAIGDKRDRAEALTALVPWLPEVQKAGVLEEALHAVLIIRKELFQVQGARLDR